MLRRFTKGPFRFRSFSTTHRSEQNAVSRKRFDSAVHRGDAARSQHDWAGAIEAYEEAVRIDKNAHDISIQLGHALKEIGSYEAASDAYDAAARGKPTDDDLALQIGHLEKLRGRFEAAYDAYKRALVLNPDNIDARVEIDALALFIERVDLGELTRPTATPLSENGGPVSDTVSDPFEQAKAHSYREQGDKNRDARRWAAAATAYQHHLKVFSSDSDIWVQLGNCFRETNDLYASERAYRNALSFSPKNSDTLLQLGRTLILQGRLEEATDVLSKSFDIAPSRNGWIELNQASPEISLGSFERSIVDRNATVLLEISDLLSVMSSQKVVSGIQRVQFGILDSVVKGSWLSNDHVTFVVWFRGRLWRIKDDDIVRLIDAYENSSELIDQKRKIEDIIGRSLLLRPADGDVFFSTGVAYFNPTATEDRKYLNNAGVRIGAMIYDFIPITHPEFCAPVLINDFAPAIAELMAQVDFLVTISDYVAEETLSLRRKSSYPEIPIRAVRLASELEGQKDGDDPDDACWGPAIQALQDEEFVLCVGTINAHKNHIYLLGLWRELMRKGVEVPKLVIVGRRNYGVDDFFSQLISSDYLDGNVVVISGPSDEDVIRLYRNCLFCIQPSHVEGWGLPIGECLAHGKVCVASRAAAIPEVGGDLVFYFNPLDVSSSLPIVRSLIDDRDFLKRSEHRIQSEFVALTWLDYTKALVHTIKTLSADCADVESRPKLSLGHSIEFGQSPIKLNYHFSLPSSRDVADRILHKVIFGDGWSREDDDVFLSGSTASLSLSPDVHRGASVCVCLSIEFDGDRDEDVVEVRMDRSPPSVFGLPSDGRRRILVARNAVVDERGRVEIGFRHRGVSRLRLASLFCCAPADVGPSPMSPYRSMSPTALVMDGTAFPVYDAHATGQALQRRQMLDRNWREPEVWGAWMSAHTSDLKLHTEGEGRYQVGLRLRAAPNMIGKEFEIVSGDDVLRTTAHGSTIFSALGCSTLPDGSISITFDLLKGHADDDLQRQIGVEAVVISMNGEKADCTGALLQVLSRYDVQDDSMTVRDQLSYRISGHINGSYSLATVNREIATALHTMSSDRVRVQQVEGEPITDLSRVPRRYQAPMRALTSAKKHEGSLEVAIAQHWPVWVPKDRSGLAASYFFWEESLIPSDIIGVLQSKFDVVFSPSTTVTKALVDSGLSLPVHQIGYAPDLDAFWQVGDVRASRVGGVPHENRFTFVHVSSGFPRKGVDVLLSAYARAFGERDAVRLILKVFPNQHHDIEAQVDRLRSVEADLAEIEIINRDLSEAEMKALYASADVMVLPTRGEGFNVPAAEALAAGLGLIVTGFGAHTDFLDPSFARLIDFRFSPSESHLKSNNSVWVEPDVDDLMQAMCEMVDLFRHQPELVKSKIQKGREAAASVSDKTAWARRIEQAAISSIATKTEREPSVLFITTWKVSCGVASYSEMLVSSYPKAVQNVSILCDDRTDVSSADRDVREVHKAWGLADISDVEVLSHHIDAIRSDVVVIQHHKGLISWSGLTKTLRHCRSTGRTVIVVLHNVKEMPSFDDAEWKDLVHELSSVFRVLIHSINDINILKQNGIVHNTTIFPHGAQNAILKPRAPHRIDSGSDVIIGSYGFVLPHKGFDILIKVFASLRQSWPKARLRMVTALYPIHFSSEYLHRCKSIAAELGVDSFIDWHTDYLDNHESLALLNGCDVVVLPYQTTPESSSAAVRTALASGSPVIVTPIDIFSDCGSAVARCHGIDEASIQAAVNWFLHHADSRRDMQNQARIWQEENKWQRVASRLHAITVAAMRSGRQRPRSSGSH